ncbi:MAG TPA: CheR family methyltransferase [Chloroflexia bacterium]
MPRRSRDKQSDDATPESRPEVQPAQVGVDPGHRLVVIGSSAGGIQALSVLVSTLPANFPAPIVLAQHLDPNRPSKLTTILHQRTTLPVVTVGASTLLEAGKIYVVPSDHHVSIADGHVEIRDFPDRPKPSVDRLLTTAAEVYGERLIAVVLTGSGSDGSAGAVEVKKHGGFVIIQNPDTAHFPSMPMSLPPTAVDHVADIENIGPMLADLLNGTETPALYEEPSDAVEEILAMVSRQASIDFSQYKPSTILRRISRRMVVHHIASLDDYKDHIREHPEEATELAKAFLIKVTEFFRDPEAFEYLKASVLPELIEQGRARGNVLRFWSAGCATGEEPYSLALLVADLLRSELPQWNIKIFATDVDEGAINFARRGLYPENLLSNLPDMYRTLYFEPVPGGYHVSKTLRQMVIFGQQDLSRGAPFPRVDLVVCRNLLIYFQPELQQQVLDTFCYSLSHNRGFLFLGHAETVRPSQSTFEQVNKRWKVYRCLRSRPAQPALPVPGERLDRLPTPRAKLVASGQVAVPVGQGAEVLTLRRFNELVLRQLPTGVVVIDRAYRIVSINAAARRLLGIRDTGIDQDFLHTVRGLPYSQVRAGIDSAFRERAAVYLHEIELEQSGGGSGRYITLTIVPVEPEQEAPELQVISVQDVTDTVEMRRSQAATQTELRELLGEMQNSNRRLSDMNRDLQDANEELQAANEELMLAQEELQATNEEFEATNEELQATSEELETNNEELQATNEELETTNEELHTRTEDLIQLARSHATQRKQLLEMVEHAPFYILILREPNLRIEAFNPRYALMFHGQEVIGMNFQDVLDLSMPEMKSLVELVHSVYREDAPQTVTNVQTRLLKEEVGTQARYLTYTAVPLHDADGKVDGVVVYGTEVAGQAVDVSHDGSVS